VKNAQNPEKKNFTDNCYQIISLTNTFHILSHSFHFLFQKVEVRSTFFHTHSLETVGKLTGNKFVIELSLFDRARRVHELCLYHNGVELVRFKLFIHESNAQVPVPDDQSWDPALIVMGVQNCGYLFTKKFLLLQLQMTQS